MNPTVLANGNNGVLVGDWPVNNYQLQSYGNISLRQATYLSCNSVYAQVINEIGVQSVIYYVEQEHGQYQFYLDGRDFTVRILL